MANSKRDSNRIITMVGISSLDGVTLIPVQIDSISGRVFMSQASSGVHGAVAVRQVAPRDGNRVPVMIGTSSDDDGVLVTPVVDSNNLRIKMV